MKKMGSQKSADNASDLKAVLEVGTALSTIDRLEELLDFIMKKSIEITGCEGASICLVEKDKVSTLRNGRKIFKTVIRFHYSMNVSQGKSVLNLSLPINESSIVGYSVLHGCSLNIEDAYSIDEDTPYFFNPTFDQKNNYRTQSILCVPITTANGKVLGAVQLVNKYTGDKSPENRCSFVDRDEKLMENFAAQAAIAIHNTQLRQDITRLFKSFVSASVTAIESRDPATSGHSARVAMLTVGLAKAIHKSNHPRFKDVEYTDNELKAIRFACLLHDFGKIGVREEVLTKAKKLFPHELAIVKERLQRFHKQMESHLYQQFFTALKVCGDVDLKWIHQQHAKVEKQIEYLHTLLEKVEEGVLQANEPSVFEGKVSVDDLLLWCQEIEEWTGEPVLLEKEIQALSITKGSLTLKERREIESHVGHSYRFLKQIAWTEELENVPHIAFGHHEKLDGSGYPLGLEAEELELPTRMMVITDIFDSLTASDRPYKKAVPVERTLKILQMEAQDGKLDSDLLDIFIEEGIYRMTEKKESTPKAA